MEMDSSLERWRDISGYGSKYRVSDYGRVQKSAYTVLANYAQNK
jgi:hypothetical protein